MTRIKFPGIIQNNVSSKGIGSISNFEKGETFKYNYGL